MNREMLGLGLKPRHSLEQRDDLFNVFHNYIEIIVTILNLIYYPPEVRSMKYCRLGVFM